MTREISWTEDSATGALVANRINDDKSEGEYFATAYPPKRDRSRTWSATFANSDRRITRVGRYNIMNAVELIAKEVA